MDKTEYGIIITIDGPAGAGKTTVAKALAKKWSFMYMDTGALFRAFAFYLIQNGYTRDVECLEEHYNPSMANGLAENYLKKVDIRHINGDQHMFLENQDVSDKIRTPEISDMASRISTFPEVRNAILTLEHKIAESGLNIVAEGRDMGSVVFPDADLKIYLTAAENVRAARRYDQTPDQFESQEHALRDLHDRDSRDMSREIAPLTKPDSAYYVDSSNLTLESVIDLTSHLLVDIMDNRKHVPIASRKWYANTFRGRHGYRLDITNDYVTFIFPGRKGYYGEILHGKNRSIVHSIYIQTSDTNGAKLSAEKLTLQYLTNQMNEIDPALQNLRRIMGS